MNIQDSSSRFKEPPAPSEQLAWKSARCSGAAPTYFRACDGFVDGGIIANNPTLDVLTEFHEYHTGMKMIVPDHTEPKIRIVVSLGTGRKPTQPVKSIDIFRPSGLKETIESAKGLHSFITMITEQLTASTGSPVDRARAWCGMIGASYFRLNPRLIKDVPMNTRSDALLLGMMWETYCYITVNRDLIHELAAML